MKSKWAAGIVPRNFAWIIKDKIAVSERPGGYARTHRRVRRQEEIIWLREQGFSRVVSLLTSPHNLHAYGELGVVSEHVPLGPHDDAHAVLDDLFGKLAKWLGSGEKVLIHQEELGDRVQGVVAGYLVWSGLVKSPAQAISIVERINSRQMGPVGRELVAVAAQMAAGTNGSGAGAAAAGAGGEPGNAGSVSRRLNPVEVIELRGLRALGHHGALAGEQDRPQPFEIDLDVEVDVGRTAALTDSLAETVDYGAVVRAAHDVVAGERWQLLERLARRIAEEVVATDRRVAAVTVVVRKLRPPVPVDLGSAGVRLRLARHRAFLGLGANLGDREAALAAAVAGLPDVVAVSTVYETEPVGGPEGQPPYLNAVVELSTVRPARDLLAAGQALEAAAGRDRAVEERHGPRPLDVDVLWVDGETVDDPPELVVPHPRMWERRFVLAPLADLAPDLVPDGRLETAAGNVRRVGRL